MVWSSFLHLVVAIAVAAVAVVVIVAMIGVICASLHLHQTALLHFFIMILF